MRKIIIGVIVLIIYGCDINNESDWYYAESPEAFKDEVILALNSARSQNRYCGAIEFSSVGRVKWNSYLYEAAERHALDMAKFSFFSHVGSDGTRVGNRVVSTGYRGTIAGENIAWKQVSVNEVMNDWLNSPTHCEAIMDYRYEDIGMAKVVTPEGNYWVLVFSRPYSISYP